MNRKLLYAIMAFAAMTALNSCSDDDFKKVYDEKTSLDSPYIFSEDYKDSILVPYDLPHHDWHGILPARTEVRIQHDGYQPVVRP